MDDTITMTREQLDNEFTEARQLGMDQAFEAMAHTPMRPLILGIERAVILAAREAAEKDGRPGC